MRVASRSTCSLVVVRVSRSGKGISLAGRKLLRCYAAHARGRAQTSARVGLEPCPRVDDFAVDVNLEVHMVSG